MSVSFSQKLFSPKSTGVYPWSAPFVIAGPCAAESETQVLKTAEKLRAGGGTDMFRAGVWKPRSRYGQFEGHGKQALDWLRRVKSEHSLPVVTEVATAAQVELALRAELDAVWIGARTSVSPFAMTEIAEALKGVDRPVFVKNPIAPDPALWIGAIERLRNAGVKRIAAVHRGFTVYPKTAHRNEPIWEIVDDLEAEFPGMPVICDPSHITGRRDKVAAMALDSLRRHCRGIMVEVHIEPKEALSDAAQQLYPHELVELLGRAGASFSEAKLTGT